MIRKDLIVLSGLPITFRKNNVYTLACMYKLNNDKCN